MKDAPEGCLSRTGCRVLGVALLLFAVGFAAAALMSPPGAVRVGGVWMMAALCAAAGIAALVAPPFNPLDWLFRQPPSPLFTPLESELLQAVEAALPPDAASLFARQVGAFDHVYRPPDGQSVNWYIAGEGGRRADPETQFPATQLELHFAGARFTRPGRPQTWQARLFARGGFFQGIGFTPPLRRLRVEMPVTVEGIEIFHDLMRPPPAGVPHVLRPEEIRFRGWVAEWRGRYPMSDVLAPVPPEEAERRRATIDAALPDDYLEMLEQCDGFAIDEVAVLGLRETYDVHLKDGRYYLLATLADACFVAVRAGGRDGTVYFLDHEIPTGEPVGRSFCRALEERLTA